jgi:hypothetical protein
VVGAVLHLGQAVRYHLETESGQAIIAATTDRGVRFGRGSAVRLSWAPDDVWVIPEA